jgi:hypothetical protein
MGERKRVGTRMSSVWPGLSELNEEQARLVLQCPVVMAEEVSKVGWVSEGSYEDFFYSSEGIDNTEISTKQRYVTDRAIQNQRALMITRELVEKQEMLDEDKLSLQMRKKEKNIWEREQATAQAIVVRQQAAQVLQVLPAVQVLQVLPAVQVAPAAQAAPEEVILPGIRKSKPNVKKCAICYREIEAGDVFTKCKFKRCRSVCCATEACVNCMDHSQAECS